MYKLIRFYNQNRKKIFNIILIIVLIIGTIQLLNYFSKNDTNKEINIQKNTTIKNEDNYKELVTDKSAISGQSVSETKLKNDSDIINKFLKFCNEGNIDSAYELITEECKDEMFNTIEDFKNIYYLNIFGGETKSYTIENWIDNIYKVNITGDILSTGKLDNNDTRQDYITIVRQDGEDKLNINNYIGRKNLNKTTTNKDIEITVTNIDTYMDYEIYNLNITNNSENTILLNTGDSSKSVYLLDNKNVKYYFYSNEIIQDKLIIQSKYKNNIKIKFNNSYSSSRKIKSLVFSKLVLNYNEYEEIEDKLSYDDFYEFKVDI